MIFSNKRVLITAGPTWVPIDKVRVISNVASGETGILLAKKFIGLGAKVTLLLGPVESISKTLGFKLIRFRFFDELKEAVFSELKRKKYDIVVHTAAVSDYRPAKIYNRKIPSGIRRLKFELFPAIKIINRIKKIAPGVFLVGFKFEPQAKKEKLIKEARKLINDSNLSLAVANSIDNKHYAAYLVDKERVTGPFRNKKIMINSLIQRLREKTCKN